MGPTQYYLMRYIDWTKPKAIQHSTELRLIINEFVAGQDIIDLSTTNGITAC
jgi:hypothetical protein